MKFLMIMLFLKNCKNNNTVIIKIIVTANSYYYYEIENDIIIYYCKNTISKNNRNISNISD